jgi:LacI family transcriptional regulator
VKSGRPNTARRRHAKVTISDVASLAGVSPMTVSRVVNNEANVRDSTRRTVNAAIEKLGYSPNRAARSLASANQAHVGLLYANPSTTYLSAMLLGVLEQARHSDNQVVVAECDVGADATRAIRRLIRGGIDGILLPPPLSDSLPVLRLLTRSGTPTVTIGTQRVHEGIPSVSIDNYRAAQTMTQHVIALGHTRIGFVKGSPDQLASEQRLSGFCDAMRGAGLAVADELIVQGRFSYRSGLDAAERLLRLPQRPTAVFASNDEMAAAAIATAHRHGIDVPRELSVCGFDDTLLATTIWPQLTTIHQPISTMSQKALELLDNSIRCRRAGLDNECRHLTLEYRLIRRDSVAPLAAAKRLRRRNS